MKGERKTPTRIVTPRLNQLEPTFLKISILRIGYCGLWLERMSEQGSDETGPSNRNEKKFPADVGEAHGFQFTR
jgi:hypothetical protein